ncbi:MAG: hypothetical protein GY782_08440 [Gammaproteobacteria bacterium]|nr:hypothetical protein [Gammaproteobacteria bacterium]
MPIEKIERKLNKVAIVGCSATKDQAPFNDPEFEIWGVNNLFLTMPPDKYRWTRWFEIHPINFNVEQGIWYRRWDQAFRGQKVNDYICYLMNLPIPVYMINQWTEIPNSYAYPIEEICKMFPRKYFTNTISYELALAIYEGFEEIHVYGVDMSVAGEYSYQRASCEYLLGHIEGMGRKLYIPPQNDLLKTRFLYGWEEREEVDWEKKTGQILNNVTKQKMESAQQIENYKRKQWQAEGAEHAIVEMKKIWGNPLPLDVITGKCSPTGGSCK